MTEEVDTYGSFSIVKKLGESTNENTVYQKAREQKTKVYNRKRRVVRKNHSQEEKKTLDD
jgi:hypothetical protein